MKRSSFKRGQTSLLSSNDAGPPLLSDSLTPEASGKKPWRKRLFRNGNSKAKLSVSPAADDDNFFSGMQQAPKQAKQAMHTSKPQHPLTQSQPSTKSGVGSKPGKSATVLPVQKRGSKKQTNVVSTKQSNPSVTGVKSKMSPKSILRRSEAAPSSRQSNKVTAATRPSLDSQAKSPSGNLPSSSDSDLLGGTASSPAPPQASKALAAAVASSKTPLTTSQQIIHQFLNRPFGREHLQDTLPWIVLVSPAEWEQEEQSWRYSVGVSLRHGDGNLIEYTDGSSTLRSLADFCWLEQALQYEFQGALIVPSLAIHLGIPGDLNKVLTEVEEGLLQTWLSDVLNGVRGQGEWIVSNKGIDLIGSEAMETFLYRSSQGYDVPHPMDISFAPTSLFEYQEESNRDNLASNSSTSMWTWLGVDLCGDSAWQNVHDDLADPSNNRGEQHAGKPMRFPFAVTSCSSPALEDMRSLHVQDSLVDAATFDDCTSEEYSSFAVHVQLLRAEKDLAWRWRQRSLVLLEKSRLWAEHEQKVGAAWKRFAITISNLFSYEKDLETTKLGDSVKRLTSNTPYRKLQKSVVDDCLRILARQKLERSIPALDAVKPMVSAFVADLSAVGPSVDAYLYGVRQYTKAKEYSAAHPTHPMSPKRAARRNSASLTDQLRAGIREMHKQLAGIDGDSNTATTSVMTDDEQLQQQQQLHMVEDHVLKNEAALKDVLTTLCKSSRMRTSRMAYKYFNFEAIQCAVLHSAAMTLRNKVSIASKESLAKLISRHHVEIKEDYSTEMQLVQKMVNINNHKKFLKEDDGTTEEIEQGVEIDKGIENEEAERALLRDKALQLCRERVGRWNPKLSMAIMEAVGVADANVRVEETTRELRQVRKFAVGLREHVNLCSEALQNLRESSNTGAHGKDGNFLENFMREFVVLLSGNYDSDKENISHKDSVTKDYLTKSGVLLNDPSGWKSSRKGSCGKPLRSYIDKRSSGTKWLLSTLEALMNDYNERVESLESFVFTECVGIQLEKHFSQSRAKALAAFEKKTDITSAINIATRKKMPELVDQLKGKLDSVDPTVSHTAVKEAKEAHLESKTLKTELHDLAVRRLVRSRETSTERVVALMTMWAKEEESAASEELKILKDLVKTVERSLKIPDIKALGNEINIPTRL